MIEYSIERLSPQHFPSLAILYKTVFRKKIKGDYLHRKYDTRSFAAEYIGFIAFHEKEAVAFYGVIPCYFKIKGKSVLAAQSADTMTHPRHRNQGLFILLARKTYDLARQENIQFVFGFPNQNSIPGFKKLNWDFMQSKMQMFKIPVPGIPFSKLFVRSSWLQDIYFRYTKSVLKRKFIGRETLFSEESNCLLHSESFISYKQGYHRTFFVQIQEVPLWIKLNGNLEVGFVNTSKIITVHTILKKLKSLANLLGCRHIIFMTTKNTELYLKLSRVLKSEDSFTIGLCNLGSNKIEIDRLSFSFCDIDIF